MVQENQERGVPQEVIEKEKDAIYASAGQIARQRLKSEFLFQRILDREGIRITQEEISARIGVLARQNQVSMDQMMKNIEKNNGISRVIQILVSEKVQDFLQENARIEDVAPEPKG